MQLNGWDRALKVTADGKGLVGHAGAVLLRKAADQLGLTAGLSAALWRKGGSPLLDRGTVLVSLAGAIAPGAASMSDIALLAHLAPVLGEAPSGPTARRALELAGSRACSTASPGPGRRHASTPGASSRRRYGFHPLAAWCANTREWLNMLLRPGSAGSNTFADHKEVLAAALK